MSQHELRILIWLVMTIAICGLTWMAFQGSIKRTKQQLNGAIKALNSAKASGDPTCIEDAKHRKDIWLKESRSIHKQRNVCLLAAPGVIAIILLIYL